MRANMRPVVKTTPKPAAFSRRVLLPPSCLEELMAGGDEIESPLTFRLTLNGKTTHCGVKDFTAAAGCIHLPMAMFEALGAAEGDTASIQPRKLPKGTLVKLQPLEGDFFGIPDHKAALEAYLRTGHVTLSVGDTIRMQYAGANALRRTKSTNSTGDGGSPGTTTQSEVYELGVVELEPEPAVCIIDTDLEAALPHPTPYHGPRATRVVVDDMYSNTLRRVPPRWTSPAWSRASRRPITTSRSGRHRARGRSPVGSMSTTTSPWTPRCPVLKSPSP